jgi:hypothetical protein
MLAGEFGELCKLEGLVAMYCTFDELVTDVAVELFNSDIPYRTIADDLGITKTSVYRRLREKGVDIFSKCRTRGSVSGEISAVKMADFFGISPQKINRIIRDLDIQTTTPGKNKKFYAREDAERVEKQIKNEYTPVFIEGNPVDLAWLGGFFDGEGHIALKTYNKEKGKNIVLNWGLVNTEKVLIDRAVEILDALKIPHTKTYVNAREGRKDYWCVDANGILGFAAVCKALYPYCRGVRSTRLRLGHEWAMKHLALCAQSGDKYSLAKEYSKKFEELK